MSDFSITIDGSAVASTSDFDVVNPATGKVFATAPSCTRTQLDDAMSSAARSFGEWRRDVGRRRQALSACAKALEARVQALAEILTREQGKPLARAIEEIHGAAAWFSYTASLEIPVEVLVRSQYSSGRSVCLTSGLHQPDQAASRQP